MACLLEVLLSHRGNQKCVRLALARTSGLPSRLELLVLLEKTGETQRAPVEPCEEHIFLSDLRVDTAETRATIPAGVVHLSATARASQPAFSINVRPTQPGDASRPQKQPRLALSSTVNDRSPVHGAGVAAARASGFEDRARLGGGFRNIGNTCYMNAVLSALLGLRPFVQDMLSAIPLFSPRLTADTLFSALSSLMHQKQLGGNDAPATPRRLKDALAKRSAQFAGSAQQDAHEFLADCLDGLQEEMSGALREVANEEITPPLPGVAASSSGLLASSSAPSSLPEEHELPCALNFTTEVEHELTCAVCSHSWTRTEVLSHFSLDLPPAAPSKGLRTPSLQALLGAFFADNDVEVACEKCDGQHAHVRHRVSKLPRVLTLHLKRFDSTATGVRKRSDPVRPVPALSLAKCCKADAAPPPPVHLPPTVGGQRAERNAEERGTANGPRDARRGAAAVDDLSRGLAKPRRSLFGADGTSSNEVAPVAPRPSTSCTSSNPLLGSSHATIGEENRDVQRPSLGGAPQSRGRASLHSVVTGAAGGGTGGLTARPSYTSVKPQTQLPGRPRLSDLGSKAIAGCGKHGEASRRAEDAQIDAAIAASLQSAQSDEDRRRSGSGLAGASGKEKPGAADAFGFDSFGGGATMVGMMDEEEQLRLAMEMSLAEAAGADPTPSEGGATAAKRRPAPPPITTVDVTSIADPQDPGTPVARPGKGEGDPIVIDADVSPTPEGVDDLQDEEDDAACGALGAISKYTLCASVWHAGSSASSGHYVADVRRPASASGAAAWQRFDDTHVRAVPSDTPDALTKGYIFFYIQNGVLG